MNCEINNYKINNLIEILKLYAKTVEKPVEPSLDSSKLWEQLILEICVWGGSKSIDSLAKRREKNRFLSQLSLSKMPLSYNSILRVLNEFKATRFRASASKTIVENYHRCFINKEFRFISLLTENIPEKKLTKDRIGTERRVRSELRKQFVWVFRRGDKWRIYHWKNKPISDWLIDVGFAITLMPFDSRVKRTLKELGIKVTDENYENIEDIFIKQICPKVKIFPSQIDRILYNNHDEIIDLLSS